MADGRPKLSKLVEVAFVLGTAVPSPARRLGFAKGEAPPWHEGAHRDHATFAAALIGTASATALVWPGLGIAAAPWSGAALLVGGALIGVPHGTSDFIVAQRVFRPGLGRIWLPIFLGGYLALAGLVLLAWWLAPVATLLGFLVLSGLHFASGDMAEADRGSALTFAVRATTPLLPVLLFHPEDVAHIIAVLCGWSDGEVVRALGALRWPLLLPWGAALASFLARGALRFRARPKATGETCEIAVLAMAAIVLPPLLAFGLYFCFVHAPRHLIDIAAEHSGRDRRRAWRLVGAVVLPSAAVCLLGLALSWDRLAGSFGTETVLVWGLRLLAALTVPHMALEAWSAWTFHDGSDESRPSTGKS